MATGGYVIIDPKGSVNLWDPDDRNMPIKLRVMTEHGYAEVPLSSAMLRELGYHAALFYRDRTGQSAFLPAGFTHPEPHARDTRHLKAEDVTPPTPRVRVRTRPVEGSTP